MLGEHSITHDEHPRMPYRERGSEEKSGLMQCGNLKLFCSELAFLTKCASSGDIIVYVGGSSIQHMPLLLKMFPMVHADIFDAKPKDIKLWHDVPSNACTMIQRPFEMKDAAGYSDMSHRVLFISDMRSVSKDTKPGKLFTVKDSDILADLDLQQEWVERMNPRQALLKFRMPFDSKELTLRYLDGDMYVQPFTQRSSTEVRLHVKPPGNGVYTKRDYDCKAHEEVMFHHNCVVRRQHMDGASTGPSYDQRLAHDIIGGWADRAASDPSICAEREMLQPFVQRVIREMDGHFGRVLSLRTSERFKSTVEIPDRPFLYRHWYAQMDTYREVRSMILVALPCPPLPVIACRPVDGESSFVAEQYVISDSHDLLAHLLNIRAACLQTQVDTERELLQRQACDKLVREFDKWAANKPASADPYGYLPPVETSYSFFCHFIREYVATFTRCKGLPDIRMPDVADIGREHSVAKNAIRFAKAQDIMFGPCPGTKHTIDEMSYQDLIQLSAARIIASR